MRQERDEKNQRISRYIAWDAPLFKNESREISRAERVSSHLTFNHPLLSSCLLSSAFGNANVSPCSHYGMLLGKAFHVYLPLLKPSKTKQRTTATL